MASPGHQTDAQDRRMNGERAAPRGTIAGVEGRVAALVHQALHDSFFVHDHAGRFLEVNERACSNLGYSRDELLHMNVTDVELDCDLPAAQVAWRSLAPDAALATNGHHRRKDGTVFPVETRCGPVLSGDERLYVAVARDVSFRERHERELLQLEKRLLAAGQAGRLPAEQDLQQSGHCYEAMVDSMSEGVVCLDRAGRIRSANPAAARILGLTHDQLLGRTSVDPRWGTIHEDGSEYAGADHPAMRTLHTGQRFHEEIMGIRSPAGELRWISINSVPLYLDDEPGPGAVLATFADVTARKLAEQKMAEFNHNFETILAQASDFIYFKGADSRIRFCSQSVANRIGYASWRDVVGMHTLDLFPPDIARIYHEEDVQVMSTGQALVDRVTPFHDQQGGLRYTLTSKWPLSDAQGKVYGLFGISRDITALKRAESRLLESEERYRSLLEDQTEFICRFKADGTILYVNEAFCRMFGMVRQDLIGQTWHPMAAGEDLPLIDGKLRMLSPQNPVVTIENRVVTAGGIVRWGQFVNRAFFAPDGELREIQAVGRDVTERKCIEQELVRTKEKATALLRNASDGIHILDTEGCLLEASNSFCEMLGYGHGDLIGANVSQWDAGYGDTHLKQAIAGLFDAPARQQFETVHRRKDGSTFDAEVSSLCLQLDGKPVVFCSSRDITERKRIMAELERHRHHLEVLVDNRTSALAIAKEAAEAANRAKSTFLGTMSHELRTPLNAIMGMTELAKRSATDPEQRERLDKVGRASNELLGIINDILDISRIEAGKLALEDVAFSLDAVLEARVDMLGDAASDKSLELLLDVDPRLIVMGLRGDPQRLGQILINLAGNAIKFTERGHVTVRASIVDEAPDAVVLRLAVEDSGIGIAPPDQKRLFRSFEQVDGSASRRYGGSGLGLAITKNLVEAMGGCIQVQSEPGIGSTFSCTVRLGKSGSAVRADRIETGSDLHARLEAAHRGAFVLVADDEPMNLEIAKGLLEDAGLVVHLASDGVQAVAMAARTNYDLILMDLQMPNLDGLEATRRIRKASNNSAVPIVALTANVFPEDEAACREAGMCDFLGRPVETRTLFAALLKWLPGARE